MNGERADGGWQRLRRIVACLGVGLVLGACARMPYTTHVVHEEPRVRVALQREIDSAGYAHPAQFTPEEVAAVLRGFSVREKQRLPLRWFAEEAPPKKVFREDEIHAVAGHIAEAVGIAGPEERVYFEINAPGLNPAERKDVLAGWLAVRERLLLFDLDFYHTQVPTHKSDPYDYNFPTAPPAARDYLLYFEPGRFWKSGGRGEHGLDYRDFLRSAPIGPAEPSSRPRSTP